jgi:hypothetical protein
MSGVSKAASGGHQRWWLWVPLLGLATWFTFFGDSTPKGQQDSVVVRATASRPVSPEPPAPRRLLAEATPDGVMSLDTVVSRSSWQHQVGAPILRGPDLFSIRTWSPPVKVAPPAPSPPPPSPTAPALPYTFLGKKFEGGVWEVFITRGEDSFVVKEGSLIEKTYRVDAIAPPQMNVTYLPLNQSQTLAIGESR